MKIKTSELVGPAIDWAVAQAKEMDVDNLMGGAIWAWSKDALTDENETIIVFHPSTNWSQGGPIIEREKISVGYERYGSLGGETWYAVKKPSHEDTVLWLEYGPTPLISAMRCFVASKLGETVDIPEELV